MATTILVYNLIIIAVIISIAVIATFAAATEFRFDTTGTYYGGVLFKESGSDSWKSVAYTGFTSSMASKFCALLGYSTARVTSYTSKSSSTTYPIGMYSPSCTSSFPAKPTPTSFSTYCSYSTSGSSFYRLQVYCYPGVRDGGLIGFSDGGSTDSGSRFFRFSSQDHVVEYRNAHSSIWYGVGASSTTLASTTTAGAFCRWAGMDYGTFFKATGSLSIGMNSFKCTSRYATSLSSSGYCTYESGSGSISVSSTLGVHCRDTTYGTLIGTWMMRLSSTSSGYLRLRPATSSSTTFGIACSTSLVSKTTADKLCEWMGQAHGNSYAYTYSSYLSSSNSIVMSQLDIKPAAVDLSNRSSSIATYNDHSSYNDDVTCSRSQAIAIRCRSGSSSSSSSSSGIDPGVIIPAVVGGVFGLIFIVAITVALCATAANKTQAAGGATVVTLSSSRTNRDNASTINSSSPNTTTHHESNTNHNHNNSTNNFFQSIPVAGAPTSSSPSTSSPWQSNNNHNTGGTPNHPTFPGGYPYPGQPPVAHWGPPPPMMESNMAVGVPPPPQFGMTNFATGGPSQFGMPPAGYGSGPTTTFGDPNNNK